MANPPVTPAAPPVLFGRYRVHEHLGDTRLAAIYTATDERLQRRVMLALLRKDLTGQERAVQRFQAEIGASARRSHPALLEVFDSGDVSGRPFMIAEYANGRSLRSLGVLTLDQALLYVRQVAGAIAACQAAASDAEPLGLYHPPISSSNVILVDEGQVKLLDSWNLNNAEALYDQAHYRAPELSQGNPATRATPVYALGVLLYELLTGVRPISGADARSVALAHLSTRLPPLTHARPTLYVPSVEALIRRATARFPDQRFPDAAAFVAELDLLWQTLASETRRLAPAAARTLEDERPSVRPARSNAAQAAPPERPSGLTGLSRYLPQSQAGPQPIDPRQRRQHSVARSIMGLLLMLSLLVIVVGIGYVAATSLVPNLSNVQLPALPSFPDRPNLPNIPTASVDGPLGWLGGLLGNDQVYIVNIAEGLNLRSTPDASDDSNILVVVPNNTPVRYLEGPVDNGDIAWMRVQTLVNGQAYEGWVSQRFLRRQE